MPRLSARAFNQDVSAAKRAATEEPVVITDRGEPSHVLLSFAEYQRLRGDGPDIVTMLAMDEDIEFEPAPLRLGLVPPDL